MTDQKKKDLIEKFKYLVDNNNILHCSIKIGFDDPQNYNLVQNNIFHKRNPEVTIDMVLSPD